MRGPGKVCRLCLASSKKIVSLFNTDMNLPKKIMGLANVQVVQGDGLPNSVCYYCLEKLETSLNFKGQVEKADFILRFDLGQQDTEERAIYILKSRDNTKQEKDPLALGSTSDENGRNSCVTSSGVWDQQSSIMIKEEVMDVDIQWPLEQPEDTKVYNNKEGNKRSETASSISYQTEDQRNEREYNEEIFSTDDAVQHSISDINNIQESLLRQALCKSGTQASLIVSSQGVTEIGEDSLKINDRNNGLNWKTNTENETKPKKTTVSDADDESGVADCLVCNICDMTFHDSKSLDLHTKNHKQNLCCICFETHETKESLNIHLKQVHSEFICLTCQKVFENKIDLQVHWVDHVYEHPLCCEVCDQAFLKLSSLKQHKLTHLGNETYICEECGDSFTQELLLTKHQNEQHRDLKPFNCPDCGDIFTDEESLHSHNVSHHPEESYPCDICKKSFRSKATLYSHKRSVHTDNPKEYICEFCGKVYKGYVSFVDHKNAHINAEFTCDICGQTFDMRRALAWHKLTHSERAYVCQICDKGFRTKAYLNRHKFIHSSERPFKCTFCDRSFKKKHVLNDHIKVHSKEKQFVCEKCGEDYRYKLSYEKHIINCDVFECPNTHEESKNNVELNKNVESNKN